MKSFYLLLTFCSLILFACKEYSHTPTFMAEGQITGPDMRMCICCCGGWFLETSDTTFLFRVQPEGFDIDLENATFPLAVRFNYIPDTVNWGWNPTIILTEIALQ